MKEKRILGLVLLNGGIILASIYASLAAVAAICEDEHPIGRARGVIYVGGLLVAPLVMALLVAGCTALVSRSKRSKPATALPKRTANLRR